MKLIYKIAVISVLFVISCGGGDDSPPPTPPMPEQMIPDPKAASLVFPEDNTECNEGVIVSDEISRVTFRWNEAADTDSYQVNLRNINTNESSISIANTNQVDIAITRGAPYEWFVVSKATGTTATASSSSFKFYNQGPGIENYAPFPAEAVSPIRGADLTDTTGSVTLTWKGTDIDEDELSYEVFFGTSEAPTESLGTTIEETMDVTVTAGGTVYYWRVITTDAQGNTSQSEIFEFKVTS